MTAVSPDLLAGQRVVVIGAGGAIGAGICREVARAGATVLAADLRGADRIVADLGGAPHLAVTVDVTDLTSVRALTDTVFTDDQQVDGVVYAAGSNTTGPIAALDWGDYDRVMAVNLRGAFHVAQSFAAPLTAQPTPSSIVLLASTAGQKGEAGGTVYCASKFGLIGLMQSLAAEFAPGGVRVNAVAPGNVDSPMLRTLAQAIADREATSVEQVLDLLAGEAAAGRLVEVDEVAATCAWLLSPAASGVTGTTINVDAGMLTG
jgi:NAD(P)-dependent dehydrogenase (short-subunit alcohol dehydrogenase family)